MRMTMEWRYKAPNRMQQRLVAFIKSHGGIIDVKVIDDDNLHVSHTFETVEPRFEIVTATLKDAKIFLGY